MSRRRKKQTSRIPSRKLSVNLESAREHLSAGRFREAIASFKELLKSDADNPQLTTGLAAAYSARATQLNAKGMAKEALVMWENRAALGHVPVSLDHAVLLLETGHLDRLGNLVGECADTPVHATLRCHLAAHYVAGNEDIATVLPPNDPVLAHGQAAKAALAAYCGGDDSSLTASLSEIPFRSPYRDLVHILKSLVKIPEAPAEAGRLLERVGDTSAFTKLRNAARVALTPERKLTDALRAAGNETRKLVAALRGWTAQRQRLWQELHTLGDPVPLQGLLKSMYRHREILGNDWVRTHRLRLLFPGFPDNHHWLREIRDMTLDDEEVNLLSAWDAERDRDPWDMLECWQLCANELDSAARKEPGGDRALRVALMLRRTERKLNVLNGGDAVSVPKSLAVHCTAQLERSLFFDPDDRDTYLRLIRYRLEIKELKQARARLKDAQTRWPEDKQVLTVAIETALAGEAFKKAADIARAVLAVDPINSGVRIRLVESHMAHARKNLRNGRPDLAEKTLNAAREWARGESQIEQLDLAAAFAVLARDRGAGAEALRAATERLGNGLSARLAIALEAHRNGRPIRDTLKRLDLTKAPKPVLADLLACLERLRGFLDAGDKLPREVGDFFLKPLKAAARLPLDKGQYESACETLRRSDLEDARGAFAKAALKRWRGEPVFELHAIEAAHAADHLPYLNGAEVRRLERAMDRARDAGDMRLMHRLSELINVARGPFGGPGPLPNPFFPDSDEAPDLGPMALLEDMIRTLGVDIIYNLMESGDLLGKTFQDLQRSIGKDNFRALIESIAADADDDFDPFDDMPEPIPAPPRRTPRGRKPKPKPKPQPEPAPSALPAEDLPDQLNLFDLFDPDADQ